ncbi:hypothetical protein BX661DRAFT_168786 [Kickxella alabastrina]|uniref:uncharacterized protein n=1 Tax=Kickxella alabastrina TaxID=61397 RepID=UPI00221E7593|nr:uncharacterized protein BX661DRAFT_168786 [Kickxella alabastrina]KAI7833642.1 hypothetical protein BX661DRAFT_168786 [Kickxella alabastrina]
MLRLKIIEALLSLCKMHCPYFLTVLRKHVVTNHRVTTATSSSHKLDNEGFNIVDHLNQGFFKECFIALYIGDQNKSCSNNLSNANGKLFNKHKHKFVKETKFECPQLISAAFVANYKVRQSLQHTNLICLSALTSS